MSLNKFRCPACGFQVFNRRVAKCEACGGELPNDLLFTREDVAKLDAQHELTRKDREAQMRNARSHNVGGSSGGDGSGDFGLGGDGGCCD
jgi:hypothetical protein